MKRLIVSMGIVLGCIVAAATACASRASEPPPQPPPLHAAHVDRLFESASKRPLANEIWSLDCGYCRENAAHLVAWQRAHPAVRLPMIAMWIRSTRTAPRSDRRSRGWACATRTAGG